jgi:hypothetical protein
LRANVRSPFRTQNLVLKGLPILARNSFAGDSNRSQLFANRIIYLDIKPKYIQPVANKIMND